MFGSVARITARCKPDTRWGFPVAHGGGQLNQDSNGPPPFTDRGKRKTGATKISVSNSRMKPM
jgi:hypothetical protein